MSGSTDAETYSSTVLLSSAEDVSMAQYEAMPLFSATTPGRPGRSETLLKSYLQRKPIQHPSGGLALHCFCATDPADGIAE